MSIKIWSLRIAVLAFVLAGVLFAGHSLARQDDNDHDPRGEFANTVLKPVLEEKPSNGLVPKNDSGPGPERQNTVGHVLQPIPASQNGVLQPKHAAKQKTQNLPEVSPLQQMQKQKVTNNADSARVVRANIKVAKPKVSTTSDFPPVEQAKQFDKHIESKIVESHVSQSQQSKIPAIDLEKAIAKNETLPRVKTDYTAKNVDSTPTAKYIDARQFQMQPVVQRAVAQPNQKSTKDLPQIATNNKGDTHQVQVPTVVQSVDAQPNQNRGDDNAQVESADKTKPVNFVDSSKAMDTVKDDKVVQATATGRNNHVETNTQPDEIVIEQPALPRGVVVSQENQGPIAQAHTEDTENSLVQNLVSKGHENTQQTNSDDVVEVTVGQKTESVTTVDNTPVQTESKSEFVQPVRMAKQEVKDFPVVSSQQAPQAENENQFVKNVSGVEPVQQDERSPSDRGTPDIRYPNPNQNRANQGLIPPGFRLGPDGRLIPDPTFPNDPRLSDPQFRQQYGVGDDGAVAPGTQMPGNLDPFNNPYSDVPPEFMDGGSLAGFSDCGMVCGASKYAIVEYLNFDRNERVIVAANFRGAEFGRTDGWRFTIGEKFDSFSGREFVYQGFDPWVGVSQRTANGQLTTLLVPSNGITLNSISHLRFANWMEQFHKTDLHSLELNRVRWYWDVAKSFWGVRFIHLEDQYRLSSVNVINQAGTYDIETANDMLGLQWGTSLAYDIGCRLSLSGWTKVGGYANFSDGRIGLNNNGTQIINNRDEDTDFAATFELGVVAHYQISPQARLRAGYELFNFWDIMTASRNFDGTITGNSGLDMRSDDELLFDGFSFGFEFFR